MFRWMAIFCCTVLFFAFATTPEPTPYVFPRLTFFPHMPTSPTNPVSVEGAVLGRYLFYDKILSKANDMSCASCHKQEYAFSDAPNTFTAGNKGMLTKRNTMPLFNLAWYSAFFWDGRALTIEEQIFHPVRDPNELDLSWKEATVRIKSNKFYKSKFREVFGNKEIDSVLISKAIGQFLRTLISNTSKFDKVLVQEARLSEEEFEGLMLMNDMTKGDCIHCHTTDADALGTTGFFSNNGLDNIRGAELYKDKGLGGYTKNPDDNGKFKIPSLRNLVFTAPYMHDGRFNTLEEVLDFYSEGVQKSINIDSKMGLAHQGGVRLTAAEKEKIIAFLKTLSDSAFITNPGFGNPFK